MTYQGESEDNNAVATDHMVADSTGRSAIPVWVPVSGTDKTDNDGSARATTGTIISA